MRKLLFVLMASLFVFGKCNKDDDPPAPTTSFLPVTVGSTWTYELTPGGTSTLTMTNRDTVALGRTYKVLSNNNGPNHYWAQSGSSYYRFATLQGILPNGFEELYLKDDQAVNATWSLAPVPVNVTGLGTVNVNFLYTIKEKGINKTVRGNAYTNVTHVRLDLSTAIGPLPVNLGGGDLYYAAGVGMISSDLNVTVPGQTPITQTTVLVSYNIK